MLSTLHESYPRNLDRGRAAFVRSETADKMRDAMSSFCRMTENVSQTKTVMIDNDHNEMQVVHASVPTVDLLLCKFVIKYFKKQGV